MRHGKTNNHLGRKAEHRRAMLAKAKALRKYVEPLLTKSKTDSTHNRRTVFSYLKNKEAVTELFRAIAPEIASRPGGYTRIIRTGYRQGDNAEMCMMELVDFNTIYGKEAEVATAKKRTRRGAKKSDDAAVEAATEVIEATEVDAEAKPKKTRKKKDDSAE
jgi:large subunit ribosomal protein L17